MGVRNSTKPWEVSNNMESTKICHEGSSLCTWQIYGILAYSMWFPSQTKHIHLEWGLKSKSPKKNVLKPLVLKTPMNIPFDFMCIHKLLFSFPIKKRTIEHLVTVTLVRMKCLFYFQNIYFEGRADYKHRDHLVEKNVDSSLALQHLMFFLES